MSNYANKIISKTVIEDLAFEPVELSEFKDYAKITFDDDDTVIDLLLTTARQQLEEITGKAFGEKVIEVEFTHNGYRPIKMPVTPIEDFITLEFKSCRLNPFIDSLNSGDWEIDSGSFSGADGHYKGQYNTTWPELPEALKTAIKAQALYLYENRGDSSKAATITPLAMQFIRSYIPGDLML